MTDKDPSLDIIGSYMLDIQWSWDGGPLFCPIELYCILGAVGTVCRKPLTTLFTWPQSTVSTFAAKESVPPLD